ncbi:hypothetical protein V5799_027855 [Amblyomma americanum]|uniref:Ig-like domain-containing protein n=1 Tax=Amblyomma americanum TaxID=6943 RepID=A0AAQ4DEI8_AMBAM
MMGRTCLAFTFLLASAAVTSFAQVWLHETDTAGNSETPEFVDVSNITVPVGRSATLKCTVRNLGSHRIGWLEADKSVILAIDSTLITRNRRVFLMRKNDSSNLLIHDVKYSDAGRYVCQINTSPMKIQEMFLHVVGPPEIDQTLTSSDTRTDYGTSVALRCVARAIPEPTITWRREDGEDILIKSNNRSKQVQGEWLNITSLHEDHAGAYLCIASNGVPPSVSKRIILRVNSPSPTTLAPTTRRELEYPEPSFVDPPGNVTVPLGQTASIKCTVRNLGVHRVAWLRSDPSIVLSVDSYVITRDPRVFVMNINDSYTLEIMYARYEDAGLYRCKINMKNQDVYLDVVGPPIFDETLTSPNVITADSGKNVSLRCVASGTPKPTITWRKEDSRETETSIDAGQKWVEGEWLNLTVLHHDDAGTYVCTASNGALPAPAKRIFLRVNSPSSTFIEPNNGPVGTAESYTFVPPDNGAVVSVEPEFVDTTTNITVSVGQKAAFTCTVRNLGAKRVAWLSADRFALLSVDSYVITRNNRISVTKVNDSYTLKIDDVRYEDAGHYQCQINTVPIKSKEFFMEVVAHSPTFTAPNNGPAETSKNYISHPPESSAVVKHEEPEFMEATTNITVAVGRTALMTCTVRNLGAQRVAWLYADIHALLSIGSYVITRNSRISVTNINDSYTLKIDDVQYEDAGHYQCQINTVPTKSQKFFLQVVGPPIFLDTPTSSRNTTVDAGEDVSLRCVARGTPQPKIKWHREDGKEIVLLSDVPRKQVEGEWLNLTRINRNDAGTYVCTASNDVPPAATKRFGLEVNSPYVYWVEDDGDLITMSSDDRSISEEYRKGDEVRTILTFPVIRREHFGDYRCIAKNSRGEAVHVFRIEEFATKTATSTPTVPPNVDDIVPANEIPPNGVAQNVTATVGGKVHLKCRLNDLGRYKVAWIRIGDSTVLSLGSSVILNDSRFSVKSDGGGYYALHIERTGYEDSGRYACQINTNPVKTEYTSLEVTGPSLFDELLSSPSTVVAYLGESASLRCVARSTSRQPITWHRELLKEDAQNTKSPAHLAKGEWLNMTTLSRRDAGVYVCTVGSGASATAYRRISLEIFYPPEIVAINFEGTEADGPDTATLSCGARGHPAPVVYWTKRGHGGSLRADVGNAEVERHENDEARRTSYLRRVQHKDIDLYSCVAKNALGDTSAELRLINANNGARKA